MPLVAAAIAPHGFPIIPALGKDAEGGLKTRGSMQALGEFFRTKGVDVVVIAGPHGIRADGYFAIVEAARVAGTLHWNGKTVELNASCDRDLGDAVESAARDAGLPVVRVSYAGNRADQTVVPLDWGGLVPLWFLGHDQNEQGTGDVLGPEPSGPGGPPAVIITPSRALSRESMIQFGGAIARAMAEDPRRVGFIASCDWAHTHRDDGPYGFHEAAERVDADVVRAVESNDLKRLMELSDEDIQHAAIDGLWQTLMLAGVQDVTPCDLDLVSYEAPSYYGMIVATGVPYGS